MVDKLDVKQSHITTQWKHGKPLIACAFDPKRRFIFTSSEDYSLQRWDVTNGKKLSWAAHDSWIRDIAFLPDGETVISVASDDKMIYWDASGPKPAPRRTVEAHKGWIRCLDVSRDGKVVATGGNDNLVKLWETSSGKLLQTLTGHELNVYSTLLHPNGQWLLSGDQGGDVRLWDLASGKTLRQFDAKALLTNNTQGVRYGGVRGLALSADGQRIACVGLHKATNPLGAVNEPVVLQFEFETGKKIRTHVGKGVKGIGWKVFYLADGNLVCNSGGSGGGFLIFWKPDSDAELHKLKLPNTARDMDISADGLELVTAHHDGQVRVTRLTAKPQAAKPQPAKPKKKTP